MQDKQLIDIPKNDQIAVLPYIRKFRELYFARWDDFTVPADRLLNMIYPEGEDFPKKPSKVMLHNSNLLYAIYPIHVEKQTAMETFFVNSLWKDHKVNQSGREPYFLVDGKLKFRICDADVHNKIKYASDTIYARYNTEIGKDNQIPLWLLGFLY